LTGAQGPTGPAVYLEAEPGEDGQTVPGQTGATGATGAQGTAGSNGSTGAVGPAGPAIFLEAEPGEDGQSIPGRTGTVSFADGGNTGVAATSATTGTMTVSMTTSVITITPSNACTFNASGGIPGQSITFVITTSGVSSFVLTWGTNFKTTGTLATGTTSARTFCVSFVCTNGTQWVEIGRTTAMV
jgi:hypothetical protein